MFDAIGFEIAKALIGPVVAVGLAWLVGNKLTSDWALKQRRRENSLASVAEFYRLYGEFFALWKLCNYAFRDADHETEDTRSGTLCVVPRRWRRTSKQSCCASPAN